MDGFEHAVRARMHELADKIGLSHSQLPPIGALSASQHGEGVYLEADADFYWVSMERGEEKGRRLAENIDDLLYWVFRDVTFSMASKSATQNWTEGQDFRRKLFSDQLELMKKLPSEWHERCKEEIEMILLQFPYSDS